MPELADVELISLVKSYGESVAVRGVDLAIRPGEFFSMLGPSGCGKTTTLRMIAGFVLPTSGRILLKGVDISQQPPEKRPVNMVFQNYALFPHMTVTDNIAFGLRSRKVPATEVRAKVADAIRAAKLDGLADRRPQQLSGGQQQRVALARSLVNRPSVLLLDEPLGALDLRIRRHMQIELKRIQREAGITFVYVTHDQEEALSLSDRVAVMNEGVIEQIGTPEEIYSNPASLFVAKFIGEMNTMDATIEAVGDQRIELRLANGAAVVAPRTALPQPRVGQTVTLAVRPEKIALSAGPAAEGNCVTGRIVGRAFQGVANALLVDIGSGIEMQVHVPGASGPGHAIGTTVNLCWPAAAGLLFGAQTNK